MRDAEASMTDGAPERAAGDAACITPERLAAIQARVEAATAGPWRAGREDMQSYDGHTGQAQTAVYADNPDGKWHMGWQLPFTVAQVQDESGRNKADAAFIAHARQDIPDLLADLATLQADYAQCIRDGQKMAQRLEEAEAGRPEWVVDEGTVRSLERELEARQARIAALEGQVTTLRQETQVLALGWIARRDAMIRLHDQALAEWEGRIAALEAHVRRAGHAGTCQKLITWRGPCTCGWEALLPPEAPEHRERTP